EHNGSLRSDNVFGVGFDLDGGEAGGVPSATERLYEKDPGDQLLALENGEFLFIAQDILLGGYDVEVTDQASLVAISGNVQAAARGVDGLLLRLIGLIEHG